MSNNQKNMIIVTDESEDIVKLKLYGSVASAENYSDEFEILEKLSSEYSTIEMTIGSDNMHISTTINILRLLQLFENVLSIGVGAVKGNASILWATADIRVVSDFSSYLFACENAGNPTLQTKNNIDQKSDQMYIDMFGAVVAELLSPEEQIEALNGGTLLTFDKIVNRPGVISYETYMSPERSIDVIQLYRLDDGSIFTFDNNYNVYRNVVTLNLGDEVLTSLPNYQFGLENPKKIKFPENVVPDTPESSGEKKNKKKNRMTVH